MNRTSFAPVMDRLDARIVPTGGVEVALAPSAPTPKPQEIMPPDLVPPNLIEDPAGAVDAAIDQLQRDSIERMKIEGLREMIEDERKMPSGLPPLPDWPATEPAPTWYQGILDAIDQVIDSATDSLTPLYYP